MVTESFEQRVADVDRRVREIRPEIAGELTRETPHENTAIWRRGERWATLTLHERERLELSLHPAGDVPDVLEIRLDDQDVVNMIAVPVADHLK
ncbi:MAG TPA: hypothetical protein VGD01_11010 [Candidatus Elarobacter sp.]|jgi:hypothetical protein